jgi:hypothetical protein
MKKYITLFLIFISTICLSQDTILSTKNKLLVGKITYLNIENGFPNWEKGSIYYKSKDNN